MVRPLRFETKRYGEYSKAGEFVYDHPFQWGSKRTGPDLHREGRGNKQYRSSSWHYMHMLDPTSTSTEYTIMPAYPWLIDDDLDRSQTIDKIEAMRTLGVPYAEGYEDLADAEMDEQATRIATEIVTEMSKEEGSGDPSKIKNKEIIALIAYLQRLGSDIHNQSEDLLKGVAEKK